MHRRGLELAASKMTGVPVYFFPKEFWKTYWSEVTRYRTAEWPNGGASQRVENDDVGPLWETFLAIKSTFRCFLTLEDVVPEVGLVS